MFSNTVLFFTFIHSLIILLDPIQGWPAKSGNLFDNNLTGLCRNK